MAKRDDSEYEIESLSKGIIVLEALEGINFEPVRQKKIEERTGFSRDLVMRTLKTLKLNGYAFQTERGDWMVGPRFVRLALKLGRHEALLNSHLARGVVEK